MRPIVLIGAAERAKRDLDSFEVLCYNYDIMAIGIDALKNCEQPVKYVATYHPEDIPLIKKEMLAKGFHGYKIIHQDKIADVDIVELFVPPSGSSALLGTLAAIKLGYTKIILTGCPLIGQDRTKAKFDYATFREGWKNKEVVVKSNVRSMSGWTAEFLGMPTTEWLN